jgi:hypothetical protein
MCRISLVPRQVLEPAQSDLRSFIMIKWEKITTPFRVRNDNNKDSPFSVSPFWTCRISLRPSTGSGTAQSDLHYHITIFDSRFCALLFFFRMISKDLLNGFQYVIRQFCYCFSSLDVLIQLLYAGSAGDDAGDFLSAQYPGDGKLGGS